MNENPLFEPNETSNKKDKSKSEAKNIQKQQAEASKCKTESDNEESQEKKSKNGSKSDENNDSETLPMIGAMFIASCLGGPVCILAGMKLGMFAAVGGGIVGYTTGKMFAESG